MATTTATAPTGPSQRGGRLSCIVPARSLKELSRLIGFFGKIGDELYIEGNARKLRLATVNQSRSAFATCFLDQSFFETYSGALAGGPVLRCQVPNRAVLLIFKLKQGLDKTVERCVIKHVPEECRLVFQLQCKHGVTKTHKLSYEECAPMQTNLAVDHYPNRVVLKSEINRSLANFHNGLEEIEWLSDREKVTIQSYVDQLSVPEEKRGLETRLVFHAEDFASFSIKAKTKIAFNLKELKAILAFAESLNQTVTTYYGESGSPMIFELMVDDVTEANPGGAGRTLMDIRVVLATIREEAVETDDTRSQSSSSIASQQDKAAASPQPLPSKQKSSSSSSSMSPSRSEGDPLPRVSQALQEPSHGRSAAAAATRNLQFPFQSSPTDEQSSLAATMPSIGSRSSAASPLRAAQTVLAPTTSSGHTTQKSNKSRGSEEEYVESSPPPEKKQKKTMLD